MAYADFNFYKNIYKGNLSAADFDFFSERASDIIDSRTEFMIKRCGFDNIPEELSERIQKACCAVSEAMKINENGGAKSSEKIGDYSVSYASGSLTNEQRIDNALVTYIPDLVKAARWL